MADWEFKPNPKQFQAWEYLNDHESTQVGLGGGGGGGKSFLGCFWLLAMAIAHSDTRWLMGRRELVNLKRTTLATFWKVCSGYGLRPDVDYTFNQQLGIIKFTNGSEIVLLDLSSSPADPEYTRLGGLELTGAFVDESNEVEEKAITILSTRVGRQLNDKYGLLPRILETFNPNKGHVYTRFFKPWRDNTLPHYRKFVRALATDNPYITKEYIQNLERADKVTRERLLYGNFEYDDDPTVLMGYDAIVDLFTNTAETSTEKFLTADIARFGGDYIVLVCWRGLEAYRVVYYNRTGLDMTVERLRTLASEEKIPWSHVLVDEDGVGSGVVDLMPGIKGFLGGSAAIPRGREDTKPENFKNLRAQCYFELAEAVNTHKMAIRTDDAFVRERVVSELQQVKQKNPDSEHKLQIIPKEDMKVALGHSPDFADTLSMRMWFNIRFPNGRKKLEEKPLSDIEKEFYAYRNKNKRTVASRL